jgi:hypothetical protein
VGPSGGAGEPSSALLSPSPHRHRLRGTPPSSRCSIHISIALLLRITPTARMLTRYGMGESRRAPKKYSLHSPWRHS